MSDKKSVDVKMSIGNFAVTGVTINYGVNSIPTAIISTDSAASGILCNPESYKRKPVTLDVKTSKGCLHFTGLWDGVSASQSVGSASVEIVLKNKFQRLLELYPRLPGVTPGSADIFKRAEIMKTGSSSSVNVIDRIQVGTAKISADQNVFAYMKEVLKKIVELQAEPASFSVSKELSSFPDVLNNKAYRDALSAAVPLLQALDIGAVQASDIKAGVGTLALEVINWFVEGPATIWESLLVGLSRFGCSVVVADTKLFVVPTNDFLKIKHTKPGYRQESKTINTCYPSDFNNFNFNNDGFRDIGHCWLLANMAEANGLNAVNSVDIGYYSDPNAKASGLYIEELPSALFLPTTRPESTNDTRRNDVTSQKPNITDKTEVDDAQTGHKEATQKTVTAVSEIQGQYGNNLAEIKYYQAKFTDRTGSFSMEFNPSWVPGTTGTIYLKYPGVFLDFYVTNVTHRIAMDAPSSGTAITTISFSSGRLGTTDGTIPGVDVDKFFKYTKDKMLAVQSKFTTDIKGK